MVALSTQPVSGIALQAARGKAQLSQDEVAQIEKLASTDRSVRAHEQAHLAAAGPYSKGGATFTFATGPDGRLYAVAGEVALDVSTDPNDPQKTIEKARVIRAAATAPADPSSQDRAVAAMASQMEAQAIQELAVRQRAMVNAAYSGTPSNSRGSVFSVAF